MAQRTLFLTMNNTNKTTHTGAWYYNNNYTLLLRVARERFGDDAKNLFGGVIKIVRPSQYHHHNTEIGPPILPYSDNLTWIISLFIYFSLARSYNYDFADRII